MAPTMRSRPDRAWLDEHAHRWVDQGLLTPQQADAIERFEQDRPVVRGQRVPIAAELLVYVGCVLAASGVGVLRFTWEDVPDALRIVLALVLAAGGLIAGSRLERIDEPGASRLAGFARLVGAGGAATAAGLTAHTLGLSSPLSIMLVVGLILATLGAVLWRNEDRPLQSLTTIAGVVVVGSVIAELSDMPVRLRGVMLWVGAAVVMAVAVRDRVHPAVLFEVVAGIGATMGAAIVGGEPGWPMAPAVLTAAAVLAVGLWRRHTLVVVIAAYLTFQMLAMFLEPLVAGAFGSLLVFVLGIGAVVAAFALISRRAKERSG